MSDFKKRLAQAEVKSVPAAQQKAARWAIEHTRAQAELIDRLESALPQAFAGSGGAGGASGTASQTKDRIMQEAADLTRRYKTRNAYGFALAKIEQDRRVEIEELIRKEIAHR
jgi:hypothetical protein